MDTNLLTKQRFPVECINCVLRLVSFYKFHQSIAFRKAAFSIGIHHDRLDPPIIGEGFPDVVLVGFLMNSRHKNYPAFDTLHRSRHKRICIGHRRRRRHFTVVESTSCTARASH